MLNLYLPPVKLVKKVRVGSKVRRVYDGPKTPLERVVGIEAGGMRWPTIHSEETSKITDPFQLAKVIDRKLERIYRLANRRLSPKHKRKSNQPRPNRCRSGRRKGCGKDARFARLGNPFGIPFHSHKQQQTFLGLHIKWRDMIARVTFSNGLTRPSADFFGCR